MPKAIVVTSSAVFDGALDQGGAGRRPGFEPERGTVADDLARPMIESDREQPYVAFVRISVRTEIRETGWPRSATPSAWAARSPRAFGLGAPPHSECRARYDDFLQSTSRSTAGNLRRPALKPRRGGGRLQFRRSIRRTAAHVHRLSDPRASLASPIVRPVDRVTGSVGAAWLGGFSSRTFTGPNGRGPGPREAIGRPGRSVYSPTLPRGRRRLVARVT